MWLGGEGGGGERENALEAGDQEELVEVIDVDALRRERALHVVVVVDAGAGRDGGVGEAVPVDELAAAGVEGGEVEVVGGGVAGVGALRVLQEGVVEVRPGEVGQPHDVLHVPQLAGDAGVAPVAELAREHGFAAQRDVRVDEGLVDVDPVVVDFVERVELGGVEAGGCAVGGAAEEGGRVEVAAEGVGDDLVGQPVLGVALAEDFGADDVVHGCRDGVRGVCRSVVCGLLCRGSV